MIITLPSSPFAVLELCNECFNTTSIAKLWKFEEVSVELNQFRSLDGLEHPVLSTNLYHN